MQPIHHGRDSRRSRRVVITAVAFALGLSACASRPGNVAYDPEGFGPPDVESVEIAQGPQRIGPLDKVRVNVFQVEELSGEFEVDAAGRIAFPLIGLIEAQGRTAPELAQHIADRLGERYLRSPNVQVAITEAVQQTITVDGSVNQPGVVPVRGAITLMRAVALARGTTQDANPGRVIVFRTINGQRMAAAFDLRAIRRAEAEDPLIYGNDIIVVDGSRGRALFRDILASVPILGIFRPF